MSGTKPELEVYRQFMEIVKQLPYNENGEFSVKLGDLEYFDGSRRIYDVELVLRKKEYLNKVDYSVTVFYTVIPSVIPSGKVPAGLEKWGYTTYVRYYLDEPRDVMQLLEWERECGLLSRAIQTLSQAVSEYKAIAQAIQGW